MSKVSKHSPLKEIQLEERIKFVLDRVRMGLSSPEIYRQIMSKYEINRHAASKVYRTALDSTIHIDISHRAHTRASMLEIIHAQLVGVQQDIGKISVEIQLVEDTEKKRNQLLEELARIDKKVERVPIEQELKGLARFPTRYYITCLDQRSRFRLLVVKFVTEIARLNGLYVEELPILRAIQIMANSELIPADTASGLLGLLGNLETQIDKLPAPANKGRGLVINQIDSIFDAKYSYAPDPE